MSLVPESACSAAPATGVPPRRSRHAALGIALLLGGAVLAQPPEKPRYFIYGHGNHACASVAGHTPLERAEHDPYLQWMLGFVSGVGALRIRLAEDRAGTLWSTVRDYCKTHPEQPFSTAVGRLVEDLHRRAGEGDRFVLHGIGVGDCAGFAAGLAAGHASYPEWPAGYLTGIGSAGVALPHTGVEELTAWVRQHCGDEPAAQLATATARAIEAHLVQD